MIFIFINIQQIPVAVHNNTRKGWVPLRSLVGSKNSPCGELCMYRLAILKVWIFKVWIANTGVFYIYKVYSFVKNDWFYVVILL